MLFGRSGPAPKRDSWIVYLLGLCQALLSFDLIPYTAALAALFFVISIQPFRNKLAKAGALVVGLLSWVGLNFLKNVWFSGSFDYALTDWADTFFRRMKESTPDPSVLTSIPWGDPLRDYFELARHYFLPHEHLSFFVLSAICLTLLVTLPGNKITHAPDKIPWLLWGHFFCSLIWVLAMRMHSVRHGHFLPRHFVIFVELTWGLFFWTVVSMARTYLPLGTGRLLRFLLFGSRALPTYRRRR